MYKILITGITGFLGAAVAEKLIEGNFEIVAIKRSKSNLWRCESFVDKISWIDIDSKDWKNQVLASGVSVFFHSAWAGVSAGNRDNWHEQEENLNFTIELLELARELKIKKFISLGSQAEYGQFNVRINETHPISPTSAYGLYKTLVQQTIKYFAEKYKFDWYWLRIFPVFGEKEDLNWFIPTVLNNLYQNKPMDMTAGEQQYAYMYVKDLATVVYKVVITQAQSGSYNLSSAQNYSLRTVVDKLISLTKIENNKINYGALPYRENQSMLIAGDTKLLSDQIGHIDETDFDEALANVVEYFYLNNVTK
ncbi:NAD-dependent epimerase/dehydratase family protein [Mucilaginibacter flavus]|uniref:NAD-dependent epimerase/dehydratase family protein n=1 Tax=Mucilaginibacter flavus TaxID=931504 RepID=UPI0025B4D0C0|nr:NAD(P)-dependent oxidoreductase [Mucilaginibacter flavus]MDN3582823.1 NAD(P)-dependent oxidoreductase [Mucilaginibacter flavus]